VDFASGFAQQGIVHGHHPGLSAGQGFLDLTSDLAEDGVLVETVLRIKPVIGRPVQVMAVLGAEHGTDGMAAKGDQLGRQMAARPLKGLWANKGTTARGDEGF
jgi:hypothetical protein